MSIQPKHLALLVATLAMMAVVLVACGSPVSNPLSSAPNSIAFTTPNPAANTPTPTFPAFTIGAWPSNYSPNVNDNITIYVICRVQDPTMQNPPIPPNPPVTVSATLHDPVNQTLTATTGSDGIAAIPYVVDDPYVGQPVLVTVSASWNNQTYTNTTFFTPGVTVAPTATPKPGTTPSGKSPTPTATP